MDTAVTYAHETRPKLYIWFVHGPHIRGRKVNICDEKDAGKMAALCKEKLFEYR